MQKGEAAGFSRSSERKRNSDLLVASRKPLVGVERQKEIASRSKRGRKADPKRHELRRNDSKGSSVLRKKGKDAAAAAELFVDKGGRKPVECSRKKGCCKDGAVREQQ